MIRLLRILILGAGLTVLVLVVLGAFMPRTWSVERSRILHVPPDLVQPTLVDLHTWGAWTPWSKSNDDSVQFTFDGPPTGVGARMTWEGQILGFGSLTLTQADPGAGVEYDLQFRGVDQPTHGSIALAPDPGGTRVIWKDGGELGWNPIQRLFTPVFEAKLSHDFDDGLERLARIVEAPR